MYTVNTVSGVRIPISAPNKKDAFRASFFIWQSRVGIRKGVKKTVRWTVFSPLRCRNFSYLRGRKVRDEDFSLIKHTISAFCETEWGFEADR